MIIRELKLKVNKKTEEELNRWLMHLQSIYNWAIRHIELNAKNSIYFSKFDFCNLLSNHSKKLRIPSHVIQEVLSRAYNAWGRCFKKISRKPKFKSYRNKLRSISFPDPIKSPEGNRIKLPLLGKVRFHKQDTPEGKIKCGRIIKRSSGWYLQLTIDTNYVFPVENTNKSVGIDTGFKSLLTLSNGEKFGNPRELRSEQARIAQAHRGHNYKLAARLYEKQANRRKDRNHKISRKIVENYNEIYVTDDSLKGQAKKFGKSVSEASIGQLRQYLRYKSNNCGRKYVEVPSFKTTMTCSDCGANTGPTGWDGLAVRFWECSTCGVHHDRDINAARNVLKIGLGFSLESSGDITCRNPQRADDQEEYNKALERLDEIFSTSACSPEDIELEDLSNAIHEYERFAYPEFWSKE